jgi:hypothetical protein
MPQSLATDYNGFKTLIGSISKKNLQRLPSYLRERPDLYRWFYKYGKLGGSSTPTGPTYTAADSPALSEIEAFLTACGHANQATIRTTLKRTFRARRARILFKYGKRIADL